MTHSCLDAWWAIQPAVQLHQYRMQLSLTACPAPDLPVLGTNKQTHSAQGFLNDIFIAMMKEKDHFLHLGKAAMFS